jgi:hypothetical protein
MSWFIEFPREKVCVGCGEMTRTSMKDLCDQCEFLQRVRETPPLPSYPVMHGWMCPRCGTVHGPLVSQCGCSPPTAGGTTIDITCGACN